MSTESIIDPVSGAVLPTPVAEEPAPPKRRRRAAAVDAPALPAVAPDALPVASDGSRALRLAEAKAEMELQRAMHDMVEQLVIDIMKPGVDYGISHEKGCPNRHPGVVPFHGPKNCPDCGRKPDLWLSGSEKIVLRLGYAFGEPSVAEDMMRAVRIEAPYVAFRVPVIRLSDGEIVGHGIGACTLGDAYGDVNTMFKKAKKNAFVDAARNTFALSGIFADAEEVANPGPRSAGRPPGAAPAPAPAPAGAAAPPAAQAAPAAPAAPPAPALPAAPTEPAAPPVTLDTIVNMFRLEGKDIEDLYVAVGWQKGETLTNARQAELSSAVVALCRGSLKAYINAHGGWPEDAKGALMRQRFFLPWIAEHLGRPAAGPPAEGLVIARVADAAPHPAIPPDAPADPPGSRPLEPFVRYYQLDTSDIERLCRLVGWTGLGPITPAHERAVWEELARNLPAHVSANGGLPAAAKLWTPIERRTSIFRPWLQGRIHATTNPAPTGQGA